MFDSLEKDIKALIDEKVICLGKAVDVDKKIDKAFYDSFNELISKMPVVDGRVALDLNPSLLPITKPEEFNLDLIRQFYCMAARVSFTAALHHDCPIITDVQLVNDMLARFADKHKQEKRANIAEMKSAFLAHRVLSVSLPNIRDASIEEVLEVRYRLRNELGDFRAAMSKLSSGIRGSPWTPDIEHDVDKIIETQVKPKLANLEKSLKHSNLKLVKKVFHNLMDPKTYTPFLGTVLLHLEPTIAALASAGYVGFSALYDTYLEQRKIRDGSGLTFLLKATRAL